MRTTPFRDTSYTAVAGRAPARPVAPAQDEVLRELCGAVFGSLPRRDQRHRAEQYVRGLLCTPGRKSIRNIAAHTGGGSATEQRLQHLVTSSTWDWRPVRAALIEWLAAAHSLSAWVVQPMPIPKSGEHSVGVGRRYDPHLGHVLRGQQSFGVWFVSPEVVTPVGWRLFLPEELTAADSPADGDSAPGGETYEDSVTAAVRETVHVRSTPRRPVVVDVRGLNVRSTLGRLPLAGLPAVVRADATTPLWVADRAMPGYGAGAVPARSILTAVKALRQPVEWYDGASPAAPRVSLSAAMPVTTAAVTAPRNPALLLGEWPDQRHAPSEFWVSNVRLPTPPLLRLAKEADRVDRAAADCAGRAGLRDFAGRSLAGWHRHLTLASVACAVRALATLPDEGAPMATAPTTALTG
ncbi:IS701 family transposase [Streptomyces sp. NPDC017979]|uniref:IS701 family transposase n=1 Tax=Streptomyces sp. NPDC017979 TaxID=3365024 RepID=UPI0037880F79